MQNSITKRVLLNAPLDRVWRALTDYRQFGDWFRVEIDTPFEVGKQVTGRLTLEGYDGLDWAVTVQAIDPKRLFSFTWHPHAVDPEIEYEREPPTLVEFRLQPSGSGTLLTIEESGFSALSDTARRDQAFLENTRGWDIQSGNLRTYVEQSA